MKRLVRKCGNLIVFLMKAGVIFALFWTFYRLFAIKNWQLLVQSRTSVVTILSFFISGYLFLKIYGGFDIGKRKSKPIIISLSLGVAFTDIISYIMLCVMNTNSANGIRFRFAQPWMLLIVFGAQIAEIIVLTYLGNWFYFKLHAPERCLIVTSSQRSLNEVTRGIRKYRLQYKICRSMDYRNPDLRETVKQYDTIVLYDVPVHERTEIVEYCYQNMKNVYISPNMADVVELNARHVILDDVSLFALSTRGMTPEQKVVKRGFDIVLSALALIITSPLLLLAAMAIKIEDGGSIFFKQNRATRGGRIFSVYKLRSMKEYVDNYNTVVGDDRITKVGRWLRRFRIDEIPQFWNVLRGDMSIVGPRPEMLANIFNYTSDLPEFEYRLRVKAGITGYAQIAGKYNTSPKDKLILDLLYIEEYSFWMDVKLIFQTLIVIFKKDSTEAFEGHSELVFEDYDEKHYS